MASTGQDIVDVGLPKVGQPYVFGASVPLDNPNWKGPWDCAEFVSWCAFQAYGLIFGAGNVKRVAQAEPFSGHWFDDANTRGHVIPWQDALKIPGAMVIRPPRTNMVGHVAISIGDGDSTLEARGKAFGVGVFKKAQTRPWAIGCLLPGVDYPDAPPARTTAPVSVAVARRQTAEQLPSDFLLLKRPNIKGPNVVALQRALVTAGIDPGPVDGEFGPMTNGALISFQAREGLEVDGILGPVTAKALGLAFPLKAAAEDRAVLTDLAAATETKPVTLAAIEGPADTVTGISLVGGTYQAVTASGFKFLVGSSTPFTDDMHRVGLFQKGKAITDSLQFGVYKAEDFTTAFKQWAHFITPTLTAEGNARFATLNSYDRAAFTFGAPQLAAHTPKLNFIVFLRLILALPNADKHFPDLALRKNANGDVSVHHIVGANAEDLEQDELVTRPNGRKERQLKRLMSYLNPSAVAIDDAELLTAARLMNWMKQDTGVRQAQIEVFIQQAKANLATAKKKIAGFSGDDWRIALWIMDILHQGRGTFAEMTAALGSARPEEGLMALGRDRYKQRIDTVAAAVGKLAKQGVLDGFKV